MADYLTIGGVPVPVPDEQGRRLEDIEIGGTVVRAIDGTPRSTQAAVKRRFEVTTRKLTTAEHTAILGAFTPGVAVSCDGVMLGGATSCYVRRTVTPHHWAGADEVKYVLTLTVEEA